MKAEVLFSILLLALGVAVWSWPRNGDPNSSEELSPVPDHADSAAFANDPLNPPLGNDQVHEILAGAIAELRNAEPFVAQVKLQINLLEREFHGTGQYCQAGQGLPKARWDLTLNGSKDLFLSQVFDGRFFYRLEIVGEQRTLNFVDLKDARNLAPAAILGVAPPSAWFTSGTLATMLEQLAASFEFEANVETELINEPTGQPIQMHRVRGQWSRAGLRQLLRDQIPELTGSRHIPWDRIPGQLPHAVEISFGSDEYLSQFPYQLVFFQFIPSGESKFERRQIFKLQLHQVEKKDAIADEQFRITADDIVPIDMTKEYLERIKLYTQHPLKE